MKPELKQLQIERATIADDEQQEQKPKKNCETKVNEYGERTELNTIPKRNDTESQRQTQGQQES